MAHRLVQYVKVDPDTRLHELCRNYYYYTHLYKYRLSGSKAKQAKRMARTATRNAYRLFQKVLDKNGMEWNSYFLRIGYGDTSDVINNKALYRIYKD